jgi:hypothetical protein
VRNTRYQGSVKLDDLLKRDVVGVIAEHPDGEHWQTSLRADLTVTDLRDLREAFNDVVDAQIRIVEARTPTQVT